ncbi:calcium-activated potassium channel subunit beta-2 isoform X4 [Zalophus californianus]|uniref:Calcium-activated potassium channel subunit beta n=1 Tax=Zalophus californianus TaxID=9704 RepID=A0A6J2CGV2_ZALCA|nr:calcium-activated potassium channel subunit beta-2 isoform X4 [Zalophus californianus]
MATMHQRSFRHSSRTSTIRKGAPGPTSSKMFIWTSGRTSSSYRHDEKRNIYQKIRDHDLLDKRKTVTALKAGEDRAILLGLAMMVCSIMMYFLLGITLLRSYMQSVWTKESQCTLVNASITETFNCSFSCGPDCWKLSQYPCLQVYVNLTSSGEKLLLYHTEETMKINQKIHSIIFWRALLLFRNRLSVYFLRLGSAPIYPSVEKILKNPCPW